jgi:hypothetical protein
MNTENDSEDNCVKMGSSDTPEGEYEYRLHQLLVIGSAACREIKRFHPDFVVILLHGGWIVYHAAYALWQRNEQAEFPSIFPINLGTEKRERYKTHRTALPISRFHIFAGRYSDSGEIGYFLNWITQQQDWMDWIREQAKKLGYDPVQVQRVLILDDTYFEGSTFYLAQQLFESSFPGAEVRFLAGQTFNWRSELSKPWMEQHQVLLSEDPTYAISHAIWCLATGSADVDPTSFEWQPLHKDLPVLQPLAPYLPLETWLKLPSWIRTQIDLAAQEWVRSHKTDDGDGWVWNHGFSPVDLLFRHLWKQGSIRSTEYAQIANISLRTARQILRQYYEMGWLTLCGSGKTRQYQLSPRYDLKERPENKPLNMFWVCEGQLLSGNYLGWMQEEMIRECFAPFQEIGLDLVVELEPDDENLQDKIASLGIHYLGIETEMELYSPQWIQKTIDAINGILQEHPVIYLTSNSDTVLGLILGCFLVERGASGPAALRQLKKLRQNSSEPWLPFPAGLRARKIIKRWQAA